MQDCEFWFIVCETWNKCRFPVDVQIASCKLDSGGDNNENNVFKYSEIYSRLGNLDSWCSFCSSSYLWRPYWRYSLLGRKELGLYSFSKFQLFGELFVSYLFIEGHLFVEVLLLVVIIFLLSQKSYKPPKRPLTKKVFQLFWFTDFFYYSYFQMLIVTLRWLPYHTLNKVAGWQLILFGRDQILGRLTLVDLRFEFKRGMYR